MNLFFIFFNVENRKNNWFGCVSISKNDFELVFNLCGLC